MTAGINKSQRKHETSHSNLLSQIFLGKLLKSPSRSFMKLFQHTIPLFTEKPHGSASFLEGKSADSTLQVREEDANCIPVSTGNSGVAVPRTCYRSDS